MAAAAGDTNGSRYAETLQGDAKAQVDNDTMNSPTLLRVKRKRSDTPTDWVFVQTHDNSKRIKTGGEHISWRKVPFRRLGTVSSAQSSDVIQKSQKLQRRWKRLRGDDDAPTGEHATERDPFSSSHPSMEQAIMTREKRVKLTRFRVVDVDKGETADSLEATVPTDESTKSIETFQPKKGYIMNPYEREIEYLVAEGFQAAKQKSRELRKSWESSIENFLRSDERHINFQRPTTDGMSPLMAAAASGSLHVIKYLLRMGARVSLVDVEGNTATDYARQFGHKEISQILAGKEEDDDPAKFIKRSKQREKQEKTEDVYDLYAVDVRKASAKRSTEDSSTKSATGSAGRNIFKSSTEIYVPDLEVEESNSENHDASQAQNDDDEDEDVFDLSDDEFLDEVESDGDQSIPDEEDSNAESRSCNEYPDEDDLFDNRGDRESMSSENSFERSAMDDFDAEPHVMHDELDYDSGFGMTPHLNNLLGRREQ